MNKNKFFIVDVFTEVKYSGNQLAVIDANNYFSDIEMQQIAREFNFAETTFITSKNNDDYIYNVRIFTPMREVPFAGHPTLGTSFIIKNEIIKKDIERLVLDLKVGKIPVKFKKNENNEILWMKQNFPAFNAVHKCKDMSLVLDIDINDFDNKYPIQEVSTGLEFIIIPLKSLNAVKKAKINVNEYDNYFNNKENKPIFIFSSETYHNDNKINCRMFAHKFGVPEDPATGSANGCLAGYLIKHNYFNSNKIDIKVEQGYEIDRKSLLFIKAEEINSKINIEVGGKVVMVAEGILN